MKNYLREPVNSLTHLISALIALPASIYLIAVAAKRTSIAQTASLSIFAISLFLALLISGIYHGIIASGKVVRVFKRIDHLMVFILIAATYTPTAIYALESRTRNILLITVWTAAVLGIIIKLIYIDMPNVLGAAIYVILGCISLVVLYQLKANLSDYAFLLLILGGISYLIGAVIYAVDYPKKGIKGFRAHEIFHLFVIMGGAFHYLMVYSFIN